MVVAEMARNLPLGISHQCRFLILNRFMCIHVLFESGELAIPCIFTSFHADRKLTSADTCNVYSLYDNGSLARRWARMLQPCISHDSQHSFSKGGRISYYHTLGIAMANCSAGVPRSVCDHTPKHLEPNTKNPR